MEHATGLGAADITVFLSRARCARPATRIPSRVPSHEIPRVRGEVLGAAKELSDTLAAVQGLINSLGGYQQRLVAELHKNYTTLVALGRALDARDAESPDLKETCADHDGAAELRAKAETAQRAKTAQELTAVEVGIALKLSPSKAKDWVKNAKKAVGQYPMIHARVCAGQLSPDRLGLAMRESATLDTGLRPMLDAALAEDLPGLSDSQAKDLVRRTCMELDPDTPDKAWSRGEEHRFVSVRPGEDGTMQLSGRLTGRQGVEIEAGLRRHAHWMKANGDARTPSQIKADTLSDAVLTYLNRAGTPDTEAPLGATDAGDTAASTTQAGVPVLPRPARSRLEIQLVITDATLFGEDRTPARWVGHGPVPAGHARHLIRDAILDLAQARTELGAGPGPGTPAGASTGQDPGPQTPAGGPDDGLGDGLGGNPEGPGPGNFAEDLITLRRLWEAPGTRQLVAMESKARAFPPGLARFIRTRDDTCRGPYCGAPIREIDHIHPHRTGGPTSETNGQGLCRRCNQLKELDGIITIHHDGATDTITPTGQIHTVRRRPPSHVA